MDFASYLKASSLDIEKYLRTTLLTWRKEVARNTTILLSLIDLFIKSCEGGKRLRGALVVLGYNLVKGKKNGDIFQAAVAYEIFQTAILIHDDVIDKSLLRRGIPTYYTALGGDHYGISQAISIGDVGLFLATKLISETKFRADYKIKAITLFTQNIILTGLGEALDVELPHQKSFEEKDIIKIFELKTAYYTFIGPLSLGAMLGGADEKLLKNLFAFGKNLGIAFQIHDDILGVFGDQDRLGKSVTSDIEEGKNTLLISYALKNASSRQKNILKKYYGNGKINKREIDLIRDIFVKTGALDRSRQLELKYVKIAQKVIPKITEDLKMQKLLSGMAGFLIHRDR